MGRLIPRKKNKIYRRKQLARSAPEWFHNYVEPRFVFGTSKWADVKLNGQFKVFIHYITNPVAKL